VDGTPLGSEPRVGDAIRFDASASDDSDGEIVEYAWDWEGEGTYEAQGRDPVATTTFPAAGVHRVTLRVMDNGGATATVSQDVGVDERRGPVAAFGFEPTAPSILDTVQLADASAEGDRPIVSWEWAFGDGGVSTDRNPTYRYATKESFTVTLTVTDDEGRVSSSTGIVTVVNLLPVAVLTAGADEARAGQAVAFDASMSVDADGEIAEYAWDWDADGEADETTVSSRVEHIFEVAGVSSVSVAVTDEDGGAATAKVEITVTETPVAVKPHDVWAVAVGISAYVEVPDLAYARADAEEFARWLTRTGVPVDHVTTLFDGDATLTRVRAALGWLRRMAEPDDLVFFYFAGHGYQAPDDNGDEADGADEFLVLADTVEDAKEETALRDDEFGRFLDQIRSQHVVVVFDSCFSGGEGRSLSGGTRPLPGVTDLFNDFSLEGRLVLAAAAENQESQEDALLGHGVFTYFLLQGLEGKADADGDCQVTVDEIYTYVTDQVSRFAREALGKEQDPEIRGRGTLGIVVAQLNQPPRAAFSVKPTALTLSVSARFSDASSDDRGVVSWSWEFGDGGTATEREPAHLYTVAGTYIVRLSIVDTDGAGGTVEQTIEVGPPGTVKIVSGDQVILSLGSKHGVVTGNVFDIVRMTQSSTGEEFRETKARVEVVEILAADRARAVVVTQEDTIQVSDFVMPAAGR
jgi:PKD repeat protein